ncbi:hypothetical protein [Marinilactibacillus sp. Marseille-P9653]|uniref:hypothetical protein n=1 Tax=Marinilactibacillus sp. Marseille-P9653 TaxID=2866583 RepID=UPI001CE42885|nr:hypothetical protein [Marinilactibacillus sp. Marseille-P9653]
MNKHTAFPIIKKTVRSTLSENLNNYTKAQSLTLASELKVETRKSWKKDQLTQVLAESIQKQFSQFYKPVVEDLLSQFGDQVEQALAFQNVEQIEVLAPLINKGFLFVYQQQDRLILVIPDEIWTDLWHDEEVEEVSFEIDSSLLVEAQAEKEKSSDYKILKKWKENAMRIYGHASSVYFSTIWNKYYDEKLTSEQIEDILNR